MIRPRFRESIIHAAVALLVSLNLPLLGAGDEPRKVLPRVTITLPPVGLPQVSKSRQANLLEFPPVLSVMLNDEAIRVVFGDSPPDEDMLQELKREAISIVRKRPVNSTEQLENLRALETKIKKELNESQINNCNQLFDQYLFYTLGPKAFLKRIGCNEETSASALEQLADKSRQVEEQTRALEMEVNTALLKAFTKRFERETYNQFAEVLFHERRPGFVSIVDNELRRLTKPLVSMKRVDAFKVPQYQLASSGSLRINLEVALNPFRETIYILSQVDFRDSALVRQVSRELDERYLELEQERSRELSRTADNAEAKQDIEDKYLKLFQNGSEQLLAALPESDKQKYAIFKFCSRLSRVGLSQALRDQSAEVLLGEPKISDQEFSKLQEIATELLPKFRARCRQIQLNALKDFAESVELEHRNRLLWIYDTSIDGTPPLEILIYYLNQSGIR